MRLVPAQAVLLVAICVSFFGCDSGGGTDAPLDDKVVVPALDTTTWGYAWKTSTQYGALVDSRDGQVYRTVTIAGKDWMAENLNYRAAGADSGWCWSNDLDSCEKYGRVYDWRRAMAGVVAGSQGAGIVRGVCPAGWHVPSKVEWTAMFDSIGGVDSAGYKLKASTGWHTTGSGIDEYGFRVIPAYVRMSSGMMGGTGNDVEFWTSTKADSTAWVVAFSGKMLSNGDYASLLKLDTAKGIPLRCIRD